MIIALRSLTKRGRNNGIKIISLAAGLAMGLVLIAKIYFEQSYDAFYPDSERIFRLNQKIIQNNELKEYPQVSGGVAVGMREEVPGVEMATRCTGIYGIRDCRRRILLRCVSSQDIAGRCESRLIEKRRRFDFGRAGSEDRGRRHGKNTLPRKQE